MKSLGLALAIALAAIGSVCEAGHQFCNRCGCQQHCKKVCRLVCGTKKEVKTEYSCECEDFCVPGRSEKCGVKCECNRLGIKCCHANLKPVCAQVRTKRVLVKKEVEKEVPDYKWVVEEVCCGCGQPLKKGAASGATQSQKVASLPAGAEFAGEAADIEQVSAEEEFEPLSSDDDEDDDEVAFASDDEEPLANDMADDEMASDFDAPVAPTPQRRGLLQALFGK